MSTNSSSTGGQTAKKAAAKKSAASPSSNDNAAAATAAGTGSGAGASGAPAEASSSGSGDASSALPPAVDDKARAAAAEPGGRVSDVVPTPDAVPGLSSAHAGPMQGGDPAKRDAYVAASGPLDAPTDREMQGYPAPGYELSSTDNTYATAGGRTIAGERFDSLVDEDGNAVSADSLFEDADGKGYVVASKRVFEQFYYPNTTEKAKRLLFVTGQRVNRAEAERIKATLA